MKNKILKLNKLYLPIGVAPWKEVVKNIFSEAVFPLDIRFDEDEDGNTNFNQIDHFDVIKTVEEWITLPVRPYDDFIHSPNQVMRLPSVVVCADYDKIRHTRTIFPTRKNIWERDNFTCGYSGKKLTRNELSIDHIIPKSRADEFGIDPNTWENLVTCDKKLNNEKDDRTPEEANMKLLVKPYKPSHGWVFSVLRDQWKPFLGE